MINQLKTVILLAALSGLILFLGNLMGGTAGLQMAFIIALVMNGFAYFFSDKLVLSMYRAKPLEQHKYPHIYEMVRELTKTMAIPMPKLWLVTTPMANAFATGRNPNHASVAFTTGILELLTERELRGVVAHELSHVKNRDILIATVAATLATTIGYVASMLQSMVMWGGYSRNDDRRSGGNPLFLLAASIVMPIAATLIQLSISRSREYQADETGAHECGDPLALASALEKLHNHIPQAHMRNDDTARASTAPLFIVHPFTAQSWGSLFSTHPPMASRVERLRAMASKMGR